MKRRNGLVRTFVIGALLSSVAWAVPGMQAQAADIPLKAPAAGEAPALWWFHGDVEVGGRVFLNDPQRNGSAYLGQNSLAKYYEYSDVKPGPFSNIWLSTGSSDGLYRIDVGGKNIGYDDQSYYLDASKAGQAYFNFGWDQTPHLYSTSAQTFYQRGRHHRPDAAARFRPGRDRRCNSWKHHAVSQSVRSWHQARYRHPLKFVGPRMMPGTSRRTTPICTAPARRLTAWSALATPPRFGYGGTQVPRPVDDVTQNYGVNGEYVGTSPWGKAVQFQIGL